MRHIDVANLVILYFIEGLPYGLQTLLVPIILRSKGYTISSVSLFHILSIPWMMKYFITPYFEQVDLNKRKHWIAVSIIGISLSTYLTTATDVLFLILGLLGNSLSATLLDINADGWALQMINDDTYVGIVNIVQVVAYKFGILFTSAVFAITNEFNSVILITSLLYITTIFCIYVLPNTTKHLITIKHDNQVSGDNHFTLNKIRDVMKTPGTIHVFIFCLFYKCSEKGFVSMTTMLLLEKRNVSASEVSFMRGVASQFVSIFGSIMGGIFYTHKSVHLKYFICIRGVSMFIETVAIGNDIWNVFIIADILLHFAGGFITTQTFALMMSCSKKSYSCLQNTHYAILSAAELFGKLTMEVLSGTILTLLGWNLFLPICITVDIILFVYNSAAFKTSR